MFENNSGILWYVHILETSKCHNLNELASCALKASSDDCETTEDPNCEVKVAVVVKEMANKRADKRKFILNT